MRWLASWGGTVKPKRLPWMNVPQPTPVRDFLVAESVRLLVYGGAVLAAALAVGLPAVDDLVDAARVEARVKALEEFEAAWVARLSEPGTQELVNNVCRKWWFDMNGKQRDVK